MRTRISVSVLLLAATLLFSCNRKTVSLDYSSAKGEVPRLGNLVFRFSKALAPDSLIDAWDSTEYISFEPKIAGRFRWETPDQLVFSPTAPLAPATEYKARVRDEVLRFSSFNSVDGDDKLNFFTAPLQLSDAQVTWVLQQEGSKAIAPQLSLSFNYPVKPEELRDKLRIEVEGRTAAVQLLTASPASTVILRLNGFRAEDRSYEASISVSEGLLPQGGRKATTEPLKANLTISSPYVLQVNNVESEHDGAEGVVMIHTSQQLQGEPVTPFVRFEPAVSYTVEYTDYGLALRSTQFKPESSYELILAKGLRGRIGGVLREEQSSQVAFGQLEPSISFAYSKALYLSRRGSGNIEVRITNMPKVRLIISKIYENNLLAVRRSGYSPNEADVNTGPADASHSEGGEEGEEGGYYGSESFGGDVIYSKEIDTRSLPKSGNGRLLNLNQFQDRLPEFRGIYHVEIRSTTDYWVRDSRLISSSDIGLIARQSEDKVVVFANSLRSATPQEGVSVNVYGSNNQLLGTGTTNKEGVAELSLVRRGFSGFRPALVIAKTSDDLNYLPFNGTQVATSRFDVGGKRPNPAGLDAFIYAERDIYRPGEQLHFAALVRDRNWKSPGELPLKFRFLLPNGKELKTVLRSLNEGGALEGSLDISPAAITGTYTLEVYTTSDVLLGTKNFNVEEFVPDRIKVIARLDRAWYAPGDEAKLSVQAQNFFGPPAANRNYELEIQVKAKPFRAKNYPSYRFDLSEATAITDKEVKEGRTDAAGGVAESFTIPELYRNTGLLQASFFTTVFDETGRPVARKTTADIFTQDVFHGVEEDGYDYYALNQPVTFRLASLNREGNAVSAEARVQVIKHEYKTVLARSGSYFRYESQQQDKTLADASLQVGNGTVYAFVPRTPGEYELRLYRPGASAYVSKRFWSYGQWGASGDAFEVNNEGQVGIELDRDSYKSGDRARILFKTPFSGRMLVTLERDGLLSYQYINVERRSASMELKLQELHVPNVYVTATLFRPHEVSDIPLTVAHGFRNIKVEEPGRQLPVSIDAVKSSRSNRRQTVRIKAAPNSWVTIAAVDNGVLQVTDFATPDPYNYSYQKRALGVLSYDLYPFLYPELRNRSSTGGDGEAELSKRVNPMPAKRVKILSYWSGLRKTDGSGTAEFSFDIPQFSGQVRIMAVASRDNRFGSAEATMQVADPVVISTALPRFLSPGDTALVPVTISNTTGRSSTGAATIQVSGPLQVTGAQVQPVELGGNSEARTLYKVVATTLGIGKVKVSVNALGEQFREDIDISVRPPSTLQQRSGSGSVSGGNTQRIEVPEADFLPGSSNYQLLVSRSPVVELADQLRSLVQYPYGCTEQTVSVAFPQLYFGDLAALVNDKSDRRGTANGNVQEAIRRIRMRQLYNGAVTLWDGGHDEDWWVTVYAAHFLLEARKAGFDVDNSLLETMLGYLQGKLKNRSFITYYYNRTQSRRIAPKEVPYSLYVLALAGKPNVSSMNYYKAHPELLALDGRYLLSAAYAAAGDRRSFSAFLPASFSGEASVPQTGGSLYSEARDEALALNALLEADPGNAQVPVMARHVGERLKGQGRWFNTQERVFSFLALGKLARASSGTDVSAEIRVNGRSVAQVKEGAWKGIKAQLGTGPVEIATKGKGRIYYSWIAEGISSTGAYKEEDSYVRVRRSYFDRNGRPLAGNTFRQNELVIVALTVDRAFGSPIENMVLTDILPAGFEIENPRTRELPGMDWIRNASEPTALDVRDDRIHFFMDLRGDRQVYYYAVRAVSPGVYRQGPASAEAMYRGEIHSYHGGGKVQITGQ